MRTRQENQSAPDPLSIVLGSFAGTFSVVATVWLAILGFTGGTVPMLGWRLPGGAMHGFAWLAVLSSIGVIMLWAVPIAMSMLVYAAVSRFLVPVSVSRVRPVEPPAKRSRPRAA